MPSLFGSIRMGVKKRIRRCGQCDREDKEWEEAQEKEEGRINPAAEEAWAVVVASAQAVTASARNVET
jgi:hypothetical protein